MTGTEGGMDVSTFIPLEVADDDLDSLRFLRQQLDGELWQLGVTADDAHRLYHEGSQFAAVWRYCDATPCAALADLAESLKGSSATVYWIVRAIEERAT